MAEIHQFIVDPSVNELLPGELRKKISRKKKDCGNTFSHLGSWSKFDTTQRINDLIRRGYYPPGAFTKEYAEKMMALLKSPEGQQWTVGDENEDMERDDVVVCEGMIAAEVLQPAGFWNNVEGFNGPGDVHGTIGALLIQTRDLFYAQGGYEWKTKNGKKVTHRTRIGACLNGDLRIERICVSPKKTIDPLGNEVHYRPITQKDRQMIAPYFSVEPLLLAAVLKYIDQEKIDVECMRDGGKELVEENFSKGQEIGNFGDFGTNDSSPGMSMLQFSHPMQQATEGKIFWHLPMQYDEASYRIHIDPNRHLAFTMMDKHGTLEEKPSLTLPPEEMDQLIRGIFAQAQLGHGRTSMHQLVRILAYRLSDRFKDEMKNHGAK